MPALTRRQFTNYFSWYKDDKPLMRYAVMGLIVLTLLKLLDSWCVLPRLPRPRRCLTRCASAAVWIAQVEYFGDLAGAVNLSYTAWWQSGVPLMVSSTCVRTRRRALIARQGATMDFYVQCYFLYRLVSLSKRHWVVIPVAILLIFAFLSAIVLVRARSSRRARGADSVRAQTVYIKLVDIPNLNHWCAYRPPQPLRC